ncbi:MAG: class I SAM-dependent methyltransferase [Lentisphaeria bacterium]|nr:class I SAM-dependent methyltransferase [Lentisphaeria bacterium]
MNADSAPNHHQAHRQFFNERAEQWLDMWYKDPESGQYTRFDAEFQRLFGLVPLPPDGSVLDVGCGSGILVPYILERLSDRGRLTEVDCAEQMIAVNRRLHADPRIAFLVADVMAMDIQPASIDVAICFACFPHFEHKAEAVQRLSRVLRPGGKLAVAHLMSSAELNQHHRKHEAVMHDMLPGAADMRRYLAAAGLSLELSLDEPGFYLLLASKPDDRDPR